MDGLWRAKLRLKMAPASLAWQSRLEKIWQKQAQLRQSGRMDAWLLCAWKKGKQRWQRERTAKSEVMSMNFSHEKYLGASFACIFGSILFLSFVLMAVFSKPIAPYDPWIRSEPYHPPSFVHLLGTNDLGNDILSELIYGSRVSLIVGFGAALMATLIGTLVGLFSGYFKGTADEILMGFTDIFLMIPQIPLIIILTAFLKPSLWMIAVLMGILWWTSTARVVRSKTLQIRETGYVEGSKSLGFSDMHIIFSDILPNISHVILPKFMLAIASAMIAEASISFLGLGDPSMKSWGMMINFAFTRGGFINGYWWWYLSPGLCITLFVLSTTLMGSSLEEKEKDILRIE